MSTKSRSSPPLTGEFESPFLDHELLVGDDEGEREPRAVALAGESPFVGALESEAAAAEEWPPPAASLSEEELGIIGGRDERTRVTDTRAVPFRWICSIAVQRRITTAATERKTGLAPAGSGLLISPRHVLTAAHLLRGVKKDDRGGITERHEAQLVAVTPGRDGEAAPFGAIEATSWTMHPKWDPEASSSHFDHAVITLKEAVGDRTFKDLASKPLSFWGSATDGANTSLDNLPSAAARRLVGARVVTAGYPSHANAQMWCAAGTLSSGSPQQDAVLKGGGRVEDWARRARTISVTADASEGQSGSPVWVVHDGSRYLVGILVSIGKNYNQALNLSSDVVRQIQGWIGKAAAGIRAQQLLDEPEQRADESQALHQPGQAELVSPSGGVRPHAGRAIRAARRNRHYAKKLGWQRHVGAILRLLNMKRGHGSRSFVEAAADWQKTRGLTADGIIGEKTWSAMKRSFATATAREEGEIEYQLGGKPKRLSAGAVGDAFLEYRQSLSVPDAVIDVLHSAPSFRLMVNSMDKKYAAATTLTTSGEPADPDPSPDPAFKERMLHRNWIARILCLLALAENEVRAKRKRVDPIATRIKARVTEQRIIRLNIDNMLRDIDRNNKGFNIGTLFADFSLQPFVEIAYYPDDLIVMESPRMLTNLEHCALLELLEDARRAEKLADTSLEEQKRLIDAIALSTDVTDLARTLEAPWPTVIDDKTGQERIIPTDFGAYYHARRIFDRRWQQMKPQGKDWKRDLDLRDMRRQHAEVFADAATYMLDAP